MGKADGSILIDTKVDGSGLKTGLAKLGTLATAGLAAAGTAIIGLGTAAVKAGIQFESDFAGVIKTVDFDDAVISMDGMRQGILDMSQEIPLAAGEIAGIAESAGQLGIATDDILGFTEVMANLGVATNLTSDEAATALARMANITGMTADSYENLGSTIVALGNNFATTESEIVDMATNMAAAGTNAGMSETDILGFAAAISSVGIEAAAGGSSFSRMVSDIQLAVETGSKDLKKYADVAGMSAKDFQKAFKEDAAGAMESFIAGIGNVDRNGKSAIAVLDDLGIAEVRQRNMLLSLANASGVMSDALETASTAWDENTALAKEAEQRYATVESQIQLVKNGLSALGIAAYDEMREPLVNALGDVNDMVKTLQEGLKADGLQGLVSSFGTVLADAVQKIAEYAPKLLSAATSLMQSFLNGIVENMPAISAAIVETFAGLVGAIVEIIPQFLAAGIQIVTSLMQGLTEQLPTLIPIVTQGITDLAFAITTNIGPFLDAGLQLLAALGEGFIQAIPDIVSIIPDLVNDIVYSLIDFLPQFAETGVQLLTGLIQSLPEVIAGIVGALPGIISAIVDFIVENCAATAEAGVQLLVAIVENLPAIISGICAAIPELITGIIAGLGEMIPALVECGVTLFVALVQNLPAIIAGIVAAIPEIIGGIIEGFSSFGSKIAECGSDLLSGLFGKKDRDREQSEFISSTEQTATSAAAAMNSFGSNVDVAGTLSPKLGEATAEITQWGQDAGISTSEAMQLISAATEDATFGEKVKETFQGVLDSVNEWGTQLGESVKTTFDNTVTAVSEWGSNLIASVQETIPAFIEATTAYLAQLPEQMAFQLGVCIGHAINFGVDLYTWATTTIPAAIEAITTFFAMLPLRIGEWLVATTTGIAEWGLEVFNKAVETGTNFIAGIIEYVQTLPGRVSEWLTSTFEAVSSWATEMVAKAVQTATEFVTSIETYVKELPGKIKDQLTQAFNNVVSWAQDLISTAAQRIPQFAQTCVNAISSLPGEFMSIGSQVVSGLWSGISSGWGWLTSQVQSLASSLISGVKSVLKVRSPSKVFAWIGEMIDAGLGLGIDRNADVPLDAINAVASKMADESFDVDAAYSVVTSSVQKAQPATHVPSQSEIRSMAKNTSEVGNDAEPTVVIEKLEVHTDKLESAQDWRTAGRELGKEFNKAARLKGVLVSDG